MNNNRKPAKWSDFDRHLKGDHLQGKPYTLTIARVEVEETHPRPQVTTLSPVIYFRETSKGLICSPTNQDKLTAIFGDNIASCIGQRVTLKAEKRIVAKRECLPIYIYPANANAQTTAPDETSTDDAPATVDDF